MWGLLPPAVRKLAEDGRAAGVAAPAVTPRFRPVAVAGNPAAVPAYPVAVVWLPCRPADAPAAGPLAHQLRRVAALAEERCGAWTAVEVRWLIPGRSDAEVGGGRRGSRV